ncbi:hypothetical protein LCGC14_1789040, partial [marine sediment metagenome]
MKQLSKLKYMESLVRHVEYDDFDEFIKSIYGQVFNFIDSYEANNDHTY